ncbi:SDR family NAD(P)-dependent oxidoreductase [Granulicella sp. 5B5]|uniref:SDR family oxidoreductase n=1 Tax=Granulicella sp. 5B5 TaxID=1617967 RepID=UPI0015F60A57|nr:SDR family oxidoreductase [Granulicella sp. 5B5]QMV18476.1 SDR family NAD(P)-dependent oxidoreductase [Granulicella sp. 5B5]
MQMTGNTILITGGGSGIGRGLAEALHALGNHVIIAGRRKSILEEVMAANPGMKSLALDIEDRTAIRALAGRIASEHPQLNVLINNAGIMRAEDLKDQQDDLANAESMVTTNLMGPIRLTAALLPLLRKHASSTIINVSSGLAFVPLAFTPTYCATKAAIHSYTQSLRYQLKDTTTEVIEIIPPYVQTDLLPGDGDPRAMPLKDYIAETMEILKSQPTPQEICVKNVLGRRDTVDQGKFDAIFYPLNEAMASRFQ